MSQWASEHIAALKSGRTVEFRPTGRSMEPLIFSGQLVTVDPIEATGLAVGDIVLCEVGADHYLHLVKEIADDGRVLIGNNKGCINGWVPRSAIHGGLVGVRS